MIDIYEKDWINHIIIGIGVLIGILLLYGTWKSLQPFLTDTPQTAVQECPECNITLSDADSEKTIPYGSDIVLELPDSLYPKENLVIEPFKALTILGETEDAGVGNWALILKTKQRGRVTIEVASVDESIMNFQTVIVIE